MNVPKVEYQVIYNGKNITGSIKEYLIYLSYTDKSKGEADEIELVLEDTDGLWINDWYPAKGDKITAKIIDLGRVLDCGVFTVDEITLNGSKMQGDTITIKGIAAGIDKKVRTKTSYAHENKTLREIVNTIAAKHGLTVSGTIADVRINRETQYRESDLSFLRRLSYEFGYTFSIRDKQLIFTSLFDVENKDAALTIKRSETVSYSITDKTANSFQTVKVSYHSAKQKKVLSHSQKESNDVYSNAKADTLELRVRAENEQQAELKGRVALYRANSLQQSGTVETPGNIFALAGNNCELEQFGLLSGRYYIESSTHTVDKGGGYGSSIEVKRIGFIEKTKHRRKKESYQNV